MPASPRPNRRVTPKGTRPAGMTTNPARGRRPAGAFDRAVLRGAGPAPDRRSTARASMVRTGHRGGR